MHACQQTRNRLATFVALAMNMKPNTYYKIMNPNMRNRNIQYVVGLNEYGKEISKDGRDGFHLCAERNISYWLRLYRNPVVSVAHLCPDSIVYKGTRKLRTDRCILEPPIPIREFLQTQNCAEYLMDDGLLLEYMDTQTPELCRMAVKQNGRALQFVKEQTYDIVRAAVVQNGRALEYVANPTHDVYMLAVRQNGLALRFVDPKQRDKSICMMAVHNNGYALQYVPAGLRISYICEIALAQNGYALQFLEKQTPTLCQVALSQNPLAKIFVKIPLPKPTDLGSHT